MNLNVFLAYVVLFSLSVLRVRVDAASVTCEHVDFLWNSNSCCEGDENVVNCVQYIPKLDLEARFAALEEEINDLKLKLNDIEVLDEATQLGTLESTIDIE